MKDGLQYPITPGQVVLVTAGPTLPLEDIEPADWNQTIAINRRNIPRDTDHEFAGFEQFGMPLT